MLLRRKSTSCPLNAFVLLTLWSLLSSGLVEAEGKQTTLRGSVEAMSDPLPPLSASSAVNMKSWGLLKSNLGKISQQVQLVAKIQEDMAKMQKELKERQDAWEQAKAQLNLEIHSLKRKRDVLLMQVQEGERIQVDISDVQKEIHEQKTANEEDKDEMALAEAKVKFEEKSLKDKLERLKKEIEEEKSLHKAELAKVEATRQQAENTTASIRKLYDEKKEHFQNLTARLDQEQKQENDEISALNANQTSLENEIGAAKNAFVPLDEVKANISSLENQIYQDNCTMQKSLETWKTQSECLAQRDTIQRVVGEEQKKVDDRKKEMWSLCNTAITHRELLQQVYAESCKGVVLGPSYQPPPGLSVDQP